ncbi:MAG: site-specific DNA-methyltransferase [Lachnospiraceae bacterium]|nr:site-specific DNA-methyltransferase [Lachnospiraceae bacterium]
MKKEKSKRNKTIDTTIEEGREYLSRCLTITVPVDSLDRLACHTIKGDSFSILPLLPRESVDLIIADPPYNLTKTYGKQTFSRRKEEEYEDYTRKWLSLVHPLLKPNGSIYVCCDWESSLIIGKVIKEYFLIQNRITWQREKGRGAKENWKNALEDIWFATKGKDYQFHLEDVKIRRRVLAPYRQAGEPKDWTESKKGNYRDTCPSNFWDDITIPFWSMPENTAHPTQKPEKLLAKIILASSAEGDLILDPFLGSGTSSVVAKKLNRRYLGIEIEPRYCIWAEQRLEMAEASPAIQGYTDGVFWERNTLDQQNRYSNSKSTVD